MGDPFPQYANESISVGSSGWDAPLAVAVRVTQSVLVGGVLVAGLALLVLLVVLWRTKRRAPALRLALMIAPCAFLLTAWSMRLVSESVATIEPAYSASLLAAPALSLLFGVGGLLWIALRHRADLASACIECSHALLPEQTMCPECGASSVSADPSMRMRRQRRVLSVTLLAFLSAVVGFFSVGTVGDATLPWRTKMFFGMEDGAGGVLFLASGEAVVLASARERRAEPGYGPRGGIRALSGVSIEELDVWVRNRASGVPFGVAVLPTDGASVDDAWFDGVERSLEGRRPEFARAGLSWARAVSSRLRGEVAHFDPASAEVSYAVNLQRPAGWWGVALPFAGLIVALAVGASAMLLPRRGSHPARHAPSRPGEPSRH